MSLQAELSSGHLSGSGLRKLVVPAVVIAVLVAMALDTKVVRIGSEEGFAPRSFRLKLSEEGVSENQGSEREGCVDAKLLAEAIVADKAAAGEKYGKPGSVGPIFPVRFSGVVGEGRSGVFKVKVDGLPDGIGVRVQTGPAINGTEVRDATGTISFGQFTNQIEYQDAGAALNDQIKAQELAKLDREKLPGKTIEVVGVFQLINPANWMVTPVQLKVRHECFA
jgi:predicted lipoprotein